jgi:drug/metabolite transporter (DMT)-like permease
VFAAAGNVADALLSPVTPMITTMVSVVLAVLSTIAYAGAALQQRTAAVADTRLARQLRRPEWWLSVALLAAGGGLHAAALRFGALTLVQPLGALTLVFAVPLAAWNERRRLTRDEWRGVAAAVFGLTTLLALTRPAGAGHPLDGEKTAVVTLVILALLVTIWLASRAAGRAEGVSLALAAGTASASASMFTQTVLASGRWQQAMPMLGALAVFIVAGMLLSQLSYRTSLSAPLATATLANPVASAVLGVLVLGEQATSGTVATTAGLGAAVVAGVGIVLLARSAATVARP